MMRIVIMLAASSLESKQTISKMIMRKEINCSASNEFLIQFNQIRLEPIQYDINLSQQNRIEYNRIEWNRVEQNRMEQNGIELNRIEQNRMEQNGIELNRIEQS